MPKFEVCWVGNPWQVVEAADEKEAVLLGEYGEGEAYQPNAEELNNATPELCEEEGEYKGAKFYSINWNYAVRPYTPKKKVYEVAYYSEKPEVVEAESEVDAIKTLIALNPDRWDEIGNQFSPGWAFGNPPGLTTEYQKHTFNVYHGSCNWIVRLLEGSEPGVFIPRTQKARGIAALGERTVKHSIFPIEKVKAEDLVGKFSRPCPMRPRHGFVDSRYTETIADAEKLIAETREADPEAEIITMPYVAAEFSGIWTPGLLTIGRGNDGATQGKTAVQIPTVGTVYPWRGAGAAVVHSSLCEKSGVKDSPYIELLWMPGYSAPTPVQLRDGPSLPQDVNYLPKEMEVKRVILAEGDLLAWEARMKAAKDGDVVYHPGGSLASHYAIHCVLNGIPCLIDRKPVKGEILKKESKVREPNIDKLRAGFFYAQYWKIETEKAVQVMLAATHNIAAWRGRCDFLLGLGLGCAFRLTVIAGLGEFRHHRGPNDETMSKGGKKHNRDTVYQCYWTRSLQGITQERLQMALKSFCDPNVDAWQQSFGGMAWYNFTKWAPVIHNQLVRGEADAALESLNQVTNAVHNGGWGFNKFTDKSNLDYAAANPCYPLLAVARELYKAIETCKQKNMVARFSKRKEINIPPPPPRVEKKEKLKSASDLENAYDIVGVDGINVLLPKEVAEDLYIVEKVDHGVITPTHWTNHFQGGLPVPSSCEFLATPKDEAEKAMAYAAKKWPSIKYRLKLVSKPKRKHEVHVSEVETFPVGWPMPVFASCGTNGPIVYNVAVDAPKEKANESVAVDEKQTEETEEIPF